MLVRLNIYIFLGKGGKNYKKGKKRDEGETRRELIFKEDGQEYAQVQKMLGDGRAALSCYDGVARTGLIRGTMRRRVWINTVNGRIVAATISVYFTLFINVYIG